MMKKAFKDYRKNCTHLETGRIVQNLGRRFFKCALLGFPFLCSFEKCPLNNQEVQTFKFEGA